MASKILKPLLALPLFALFSLGCGFVSLNNGGEGVKSSEAFISRSGDKEIHFEIIDKDLAGFPVWKPGVPTPISIDQAIAVASKDLPKYSKNLAGWQIQGINLTRLHSGGLHSDKWVYLVQYQRENSPDHVEIPVAMSGVAVVGIERPLDKKNWPN